MITIEPTITLGALVTEHPELARELERRGFDYCCGGQARLQDACEALGLPTGAVVEHLNAACEHLPAPDWATFGPDQLIDHLLDTHHRYLWDELPRLDALVQRIHSVHGERHPELARVVHLYGAIRADLEPHLLKEERVLFPLIRERSPMALRGPMAVMMHEHDRLGELLATMREVTDGYQPPADGCASYTACYAGLEELEADTHLHVHKENNVLFPMVRTLLGE